MHTTNTVLVAIDFSPESTSAFRWAVEYARLYGARLILLHVVHDPADHPGKYGDLAAELLHRSPEPGERAEEVARRLLDVYVDRTVGDTPPETRGVDVEARLVTGVPAPRIVESAETSGARHIVLASRGLGGLKRALIGSTAARVVELAHVPVTVVKTPPAAEGADA